MERTWKKIDVESNRDYILDMVDETIRIKREILYISSSTPINLIIPKIDFDKLLHHMLLEVYHFRDSMSGNLSLDEEVSFYKRELEQHTELAANSITNNNSLRKKLYEMVLEMKKTRKIDKAIDLIIEGGDTGNKLLSMVDMGEVQSLMTPLMILHEISETMHGEEKLRSLGIRI